MVKQINFGSQIFSVVVTDKLMDNDEATRLGGLIRYNSSEIMLDADKDIQSQVDTLFHECIHYFIMSNGYANQDTINPDRLEGLIEMLSNQFLQLLRLNPKLMEAVQGLS